MPIATFRGEIDLADDLTAWGAWGMRDGDEKNRLANPRANADGSTTAYRFDNVREDDVSTGEVGVRGKAVTGAVTHELVASASTFSSTSRNAYAFSNFAGFAIPAMCAPAVAAPAAIVVALVVSHLTTPPGRHILESVRDLRVPGGETVYDREVRRARQRRAQ